MTPITASSLRLGHRPGCAASQAIIEHCVHLAGDYRWDEHGICRSPGKFEGETVFTMYIYDCAMEGDEEVTINATEAIVFGPLGFREGETYVASESNSGFVSAALA